MCLPDGGNIGGLCTPCANKDPPFNTGPFRGLPTLEAGATMLLLPKRVSKPSTGDGEFITRITWLLDVGEFGIGVEWILRPETSCPFNTGWATMQIIS